MNNSSFLFSLLFICICLKGITRAANYTLEEELRTYLFKNNTYSTLSIPMLSIPLKIYVSLSLYTMNKLDIKTETMESSAFVLLAWGDDRLVWNDIPAYSSITKLSVKEADIWVPKVAISNAVSDLSIFHDENILITLSSTGFVSWATAQLQQTHCHCDVTYYPFDTQTCEIKLLSWGYNLSELELNFDATNPVTDFAYSANGEWEFLRYSTKIKDSAAGSFSYVLRELLFLLTFKRRPLFYFMTSLVPVTLLSILSCMTFKVPADSGEKIGFCLTVLLAFAVYLTIVSDSIPSTSMQTAFLSVYLLTIMAVCIASVLITLFVLQCHHAEEDKPMPNWLKVLIKHVMIPLTCRNGCMCRRKLPNKTDVIHVSSEKKNEEDEDDKKVELSWKECGKLTDDFGFNISFFTTSFMTMITYSALLYGYVNQ